MGHRAALELISTDLTGPPAGHCKTSGKKGKKILASQHRSSGGTGTNPTSATKPSGLSASRSYRNNLHLSLLFMGMKKSVTGIFQLPILHPN